MENKEKCSVEGCKRPYRSKSYCAAHFKKWRRGEMPTKTRYKTCGEGGCKKALFKFGYCETHYQAWVASRKPAAPVAAPEVVVAAAPVEAAAATPPSETPS